MKKKIAIIIPVFSEEDNLLDLYKRLNTVTETQINYEWEYIFINDGSQDSSLEVLRELSFMDKRNKVLDFSRNFGKEIALTAGMHEAKEADAVICIDADLQHPPEIIPELISAWNLGAEIIATVRITTEKQPLLRKLGSKLFYWIMSNISDLDITSQTTDFRLYDKNVITSFLNFTEHERMFRGIMDWMGFRKVYVEFKAEARIKGDVGYSYPALWNLAINSITSFSLWPLKILSIVGLLIFFISGSLLLWMVTAYLFSSQVMYTPLAIVVVANTFLFGILLMAMGFVAIYIGKIHIEAINRPLYILREKLNCD